MNLTQKIKMIATLRANLTVHEADAKAKSEGLRHQIGAIQREIEIDGAMLDLVKIDLAKTVMFVRGRFSNAGEDRESVVADAVHQIATGERRGYRGLDFEAFGTKSYDRWHGQRCDCGPGMGPRHGTIIFQVGLRRDVQVRGGLATVSDEEREACVYFLTHLEAVQDAETRASA